ncbi:hypothetical protein EYR40_007409 [Pleurotus pulmonarius]|nr:hypothetical protein EYR36_008248 [Pleurotus pulmonarius]KAF4579990.1 hypothetical protein EYR36_001810 [Pleurotus pulmonarius]KAF4596959.1 hypothetical protein EYR40_007409 [Pleurotus pulmonarius]
MRPGPGHDRDRPPRLSTSPPPPPTNLPHYPLESRPFGRVFTRFISALNVLTNWEAPNASSGHVPPPQPMDAQAGDMAKEVPYLGTIPRLLCKRLSRSSSFDLPAGAGMVPNHNEVEGSYLSPVHGPAIHVQAACESTAPSLK